LKELCLRKLIECKKLDNKSSLKMPQDIELECKRFLKCDESARVVFQLIIIKALTTLYPECLESDSADSMLTLLLDIAKLDIEADRTEDRLRIILKFLKHAVTEYALDKFADTIFSIVHDILAQDVQMSKNLRKKALKLADHAFGNMPHVDRKYYLTFVWDFTNRYTTELLHLRQEIWSFIEKILADDKTELETIRDIAAPILKMMTMEQFEKVTEETQCIFGNVIIAYELLLCRLRILNTAERDEMFRILNSWLQPNGWFHQLLPLHILHTNKNELAAFTERVAEMDATYEVFEKYVKEPHMQEIVQLTESEE